MKFSAHVRNLYWTFAALGLAFSAPVLAQPTTSLIANGNFETDADGNQWPDGWGTLQDASYGVEDGNHFLRLTSPEAGKTVLMYVPVNIPAGTKALELTWRQRVSNLKVGKNSWFDARIMMNFKDVVGGTQINPSPAAPNARSNSNGWEEKSTKFIVPEGAKVLEFMPTLFQVETGTYDLDDIVIKPTDATELEAAANAKKITDDAQKAKQAQAQQDNAAKLLEQNGGLLMANGDFEADKDGDAWPDGWGKLDGRATYETEDGNHFLRLKSTKVGEMVMMYRPIDIPASVKAIELSFRMRTTNLKPGAQPWFDARIMMNFKDMMNGKQLDPSPSPPYTRGDTKGWVTRTQKFLVPEGARLLEFMPSLFQVESGTLDLDDISFKPTDAELLKIEADKAAITRAYLNLAPEAPQTAKWPEELHVKGNQIVNKSGKNVWLQGVNIASLEWSVKGESVLRATQVSIDDWKSNIIRLPVSSEYWFGKGAEDSGTAYRKLVDDLIILAANRGAYTMLDLHHFGAPRARDVDFWKDAATRYKNNSNVIFDLFNEPHSVPWNVWRDGGFVADKNAPADEDNFLSDEEKALKAKGYHSVGMQRLVDTVRETGAKNIVVVGGLDWAYDLSGIEKGFALNDKGGNGIMYSTHVYPWKSNWQNAIMPVAAKYPIMVGEVGANTKKMTWLPAEQQEDAATWVPKMLGFIQKHKLNWTGFSFHPAASPIMITGWDFTPTPEWGTPAKRALAGEQFPYLGMR